MMYSPAPYGDEGKLILDNKEPRHWRLSLRSPVMLFVNQSEESRHDNVDGVDTR